MKNDAFVGWGTSDSVAPRTSQKLQGDMRGCQYSPPPKKIFSHLPWSCFLRRILDGKPACFPTHISIHISYYISIFTHAFTLAYMISLQRNLALLALGMSQIWGKKSRNLSLVGIAPPPLTILVLIITAYHPRPRLPKRPWAQPWGLMMLAGSYWEDEVFQMLPMDIQSIMHTYIYIDYINCIEDYR